MKTEIVIDDKDLRAAIAYAVPYINKTAPEIVMQRTYNVAGRAFKATNPQDVPGTRAKVKAYLNRQLAQKVRMTAKGKFVKRGKKTEQFKLANLIIQARRKKEGKRGLYGDAMTAVTAEFVRVAQISVGFLKSVYLPILMTLKGLVKYKMAAAETKNIARWPGSAGHGTVTLPRAGANTFAIMEMAWKIPAGQMANVAAITTTAMQKAITDEAIELTRHVDEKLKILEKKISAK